MGIPPRFDGAACVARRTERGLTGAQLAQSVGISKSHLYQIEIGDKQPSFTVAAALARQLDVTLDALITQPATT